MLLMALMLVEVMQMFEMKLNPQQLLLLRLLMYKKILKQIAWV
jgi:hypothetical protein